jgi:membrane-associated protease RseP (regulator of RpoE activity)
VTQPDAPAVTAPAAPAPTVAPAAAAAPPRERRTVGVPVWLLVLLAAVVGAAAMFGIGYAVGNDSNDDTAAISVPRNNPFGDGDQQVPGIPNRPNLPNVPDRNDDDQEAPETRPVSGTFLGVATEATDDGLEIVRLVPNSAAADAGLRVGDVIVEFDDDEVTTSADLADAVADHDPGDDVEIVYTRGGTRQTVTVELGSRNTTNSN